MKFIAYETKKSQNELSRMKTPKIRNLTLPVGVSTGNGVEAMA